MQYLKGTNDKGIILKSNPTEGIKCFVDVVFARGDCNESRDDSVSVFSRTGYVIFYVGCLVLWGYKMQSGISLSTVEAEYVALSTAMRDLIPFTDQVKELSKVFQQGELKTQMQYTLFEDNNGALDLAKTPRYHLRTKYIAIKYHHFRERVQHGLVPIHPIDTEDKIADQFTKTFQVGTFVHVRSRLSGW